MPLQGRDYARRTQREATRDGRSCGRWIACDESGYDGERLWARKTRHLVYAAVAVDDHDAAEIVVKLRAEAGIQQAPELKYSHFKFPARLAALSRLWRDGPLEGRCLVYVLDKEFATAAKMIDLLLEERCRVYGYDLYTNREARTLAKTLTCYGRRAMGTANYERLMEAFVTFAATRYRGPRDLADATSSFFDALSAARGVSTVPAVTEILEELLHTRHQGDSLHSDVEPLPALELLVPAVAQASRLWSDSLGQVSLLTDEHRALTDNVLDEIHRQVRFGTAVSPSAVIPPAPLANLVRGDSTEHPAIQLADLLAGAAAQVAARHAGRDTPPGLHLTDEVMPLVAAESLLPYTVSRLSRPGGAP